MLLMTEPEMLVALQFRREQRRALAAANESIPPDITVSVFVRQYRHDCPVRGPSVALELREHYVFSPVAFLPRPPGDPRAAEIVPEKRFGFIWTEGRCGACNMTARSGTGRLVDAVVRPPSQHAIVTP